MRTKGEKAARKGGYLCEIIVNSPPKDQRQLIGSSRLCKQRSFRVSGTAFLRCLRIHPRKDNSGNAGLKQAVDNPGGDHGDGNRKHAKGNPHGGKCSH
jgi:hypothetical protein